MSPPVEQLLDAGTPDGFLRFHPGRHEPDSETRSDAATDIARDVRFGYCTIAGLSCAGGLLAVFAIGDATSAPGAAPPRPSPPAPAALVA